jgi:serine protease AprX
MLFQEVSWIRSNLYKFCPTLRNQALEWYRPFRFVPCFLQKYFKGAKQRLKKLSVIVQMEPARGDFNSYVTITAKSSGCKVNRQLSLINSFSTKVNAKMLEKLIKDNMVKRVWYDAPVRTVLNVASPAVKATDVWESNITGEGVGVAVIDTGVYPHADLGDRIKAFKDFIGNKPEAYDDNGHGTHVAGCIASNGTQTNGIYKGAAPGADIIGVKVLNKLGSGSLSTVIEGINWCIDNQVRYGIRVINMSLGSSATQPSSEDPVCIAVEEAWKAGIVVCAAAGNEGPEERTIGSPGIDPMIITVGAIDDKNSFKFSDYSIAEFSSRGPTIDGLAKPDIVCPGTNIVSLRSPNSLLDKQNKSARVGTGYISLSGTSMATPVCAGAAALILKANPNLTPDEVKANLISSAETLGEVPNCQGAGLINVFKAITPQ